MRLRSIKSRLNLLIAAIVMLLAIGLLNYILNSVGHTAKSNLQKITGIEKDFSSILLSENEILRDHSKADSIEQDYQILRQSCSDCHQPSRDRILEQRQQRFQELVKIQSELTFLQTSVHETLRDIIESVKYIHTHHIAYLKNSLRRGNLSEDNDAAARFTRSPVHSASEPDIIKTAVAVYTSLYNIFESFYDLDNTADTARVRRHFSERMNQYFTHVNRFEDYSLDAQDGLLIEELLVTGRSFERSFENLLELESRQHASLLALNQSRQKIKAIINGICATLGETNEQISRLLHYLNLFALLTAVSTAAWIVVNGSRIVREIRKTVTQTKKIQQDLSYQIGIDGNNFAEFRIVFQTLNSMAFKINDQMQMLRKGRDELEVRVKERTRDLGVANEQLQMEILDRKQIAIALRKAHDELEKRVIARTAELTQSNRQLQVEIKGRELAQKKAERASRAKSDFLANMSHELRTPLNHIIGFTELVVDNNFGELNATQSEFLNDVLDSGTHLLSLINDILDLAKVEAGRLELKSATIDLKSLLENSLVMISEKAVKHGIGLKTVIDGLPETIMADERKLKQIMYNLLSNAVKFTPDGGAIVLTAQPSEYPLSEQPGDENGTGRSVKITVSDTGIGLKPDELERIFNPFEQAESSASRTYQGTGLGLSLTESLVKLHGGRIWAASEGAGQGSTFSFILPV